MHLPISVLLSALVLAHSALAFPNFTPDDMKRVETHVKCHDKQKSRKFVLPPPPTDTSTKAVPDKDHQYQAPGPTDQRGPCPCMNTLANHGYIPHTGIASVEQIIEATMDAFNLEHAFASFLASVTTLARGNANTGMLSIGFNDTRVPPLPGCVDGPVAGGLAMHGRFEGDVSQTRRDVHIGDNVHFQEDLFDMLVNYTSMYGEPSTAGPNKVNNIANLKTMQEFKFDRFVMDQMMDGELHFQLDRQMTSYAETAFILTLFAGDMADNLTITVDRMAPFFQHQTFPPDFRRRSTPAGLEVIATTAGMIQAAHPVSPGSNDKHGNYVADVPFYRDFVGAHGHALLINNLPAVLLNQTGVFKENVDTMLELAYAPFRDFGNCSNAYPMAMGGT